MTPLSESQQRIKRFQKTLIAHDIDGALFIYPVDVYYFTGTRQNATLWLPAYGDPILLVRKSYERARKESLISDVRPFPGSKDFPGLFRPEIKKVGLTFDVLPVQYYRFYEKLLAGREFVDISALNRDLRSVKSGWEQERLRESGKSLAGVFSQIPSFLRQGMTELELASEMEARLRKTGNGGVVRMRSFGQDILGLAVSGPGAAEPGCFDGPVTGSGLSPAAPYGSSSFAIGPGVPIMLDYACIFDGYFVDMTRMFVFGGLDPELHRAFNTALDILAWIVVRLRPGIVCEDLYLGALEMAGKAGLDAYFMGFPGEQAKFVGHGVGLELDELPVLARGCKDPLHEGQVLAVEPKFVFPGRGVVGIENTYLVTPGGGEKLTVLPDDIIVLQVWQSLPCLPVVFSL